MPSPEKLIIDTPEQIALEFPLASAGSRFMALGIDTLLQIGGFLLLALVALLAVWIGRTWFAPFTNWALAILVLLGFLIYYGYFALFETIWSGQTPGKRAIGIRVISASGRPLGPFEAILRNLLRIVDQLPVMYAVGLVSLFFTARNQRLGDLAAGTVVVYDQTIARPEMLPSGVVTRHGAAGLTGEEIAIVELFLQRRYALDSYLRLTTARQILERLRPRLQLPPDATADEERLLEEIAAEYRRR